jgi:hypothetical protein
MTVARQQGLIRAGGGRTTATERRHVLIFAVIVMAALMLPYLIGALRQGDRSEWAFSGFVIGVEDGNSYLAKMRVGARSGWGRIEDWLFTMVYSNEPHTPGLIFTPYIALGKLAALVQDPRTDSPQQPFAEVLIAVFHGARFAFGILCILATHAFIALFLPRGPLRWAALTLATLGGGLGWLLVLIGQPGLLGAQPIDFFLPEAYAFLILYSLPHLALARAALLAGFVLLIRGRGPGRWLLAGLCWLVMGVCVPFYVAVLYALFGAWGLAALIRSRRFPLGLFIRCAVAAVVPLPYLLYNTALFATDPVLGAWTGQNRLPSPHPLHYLIGFAVPGLLALFALRWAWRRGRIWPAHLLLIGWVAAAPLLAYLPVTVQRRLLEGIFVPLCILAVAGLRFVIAPALRYRRRTARVVWRRGLVLTGVLVFQTTILIWVGGLATANAPGPDNAAFIRGATIRNAQAVSAAVPPGTFALSDYATGNALPAWSNLRAYVGHGPETINVEAKRAQALDLLTGPNPTDGSVLAALRAFSGLPVRAVVLPRCEPVTEQDSAPPSGRWLGLIGVDRPLGAADLGGACRAGYAAP